MHIIECGFGIVKYNCKSEGRVEVTHTHLSPNKIKNYDYKGAKVNKTIYKKRTLHTLYT